MKTCCQCKLPLGDDLEALRHGTFDQFICPMCFAAHAATLPAWKDTTVEVVQCAGCHVTYADLGSGCHRCVHAYRMSSAVRVEGSKVIDLEVK